MKTTTPSDTVLDETPARALKFLGAVSHNPYIRAVLEKRGYDDKEHEHGWALLLKASGYRQPAVAAVPVDKEAQQALAELDAWDEPNFRVARAALGRYAEQLAFVFDGLEPATGAGAVVSVTTFLDRVDALRSGHDRRASRKEDHAALAKLEGRGITAHEGKRLRKLIEVAKRGVSAADTPAPVTAVEPGERRAAKEELYAFFAEWSEVAKADVRRRDYLIQLGLGKRKVAKKGDKTAAPAVAATSG